MTDRNKLLELAERCEKATGPDFAIDAEIAVTAAGYVLEKRGRDQKAWYYHPTERRRSASEYGGFDRLPRYTASLDAAMTLVPEGWVFVRLQRERSWRNDPRGDVWLLVAEMMDPHGDGYAKADALTGPLALCAAALRSQASRITHDDQ